MDKQSVDLGKDSVGKLLLKLSVPAITAQIINALYNIVDRMYIGHIPENGDLALTGLGLCFPVIIIIMAFASLMAQGAAPIAAIHMGKNDNDTAENIMGNSFIMLILAAVVITIVFQIFREPILYAMGASDNTIVYASQYLRIYLWGTLPVLLTLGMNMFVNTQGFSKVGMKTVLIGAISNIILDPVFIYGFGMGVEGAAYATIISQTISAVWVMAFLFGKQTKLRLKKKNFILKKSILISALSLGLSPFVMTGTESLINIVLNTSLQRTGGDIAVGAMTIISSVMQFVFLPLQGLGQGAQPIISYNFGAKNYSRVKETFKLFIKTAICMTAVVWVVTIFGAPIISKVFTKSEELINFTVPAMRTYFFMVVAMGVQTSCQQTFLATGQAKISLFLALLRKIILLAPLAITFSYIWGSKGVFFAEPVSDLTAATVTFIMFMRNRHYIFEGLDKKKVNIKK